MGTAPILEMARAYGLRPRLWLLIIHNTLKYLEGYTLKGSKEFK